MRSAIRFLIAITTAAVAAACERAPTDVTTEPRFSAADRVVEEFIYDFTDSAFSFACNADGEPIPPEDGELVDMEGQIFQRIVLLQDGKGAYHYRMHTMPLGLRGVGAVSGEEFRVLERDQAVGNQKMAGGTGMYREELKLTGKDTHRTFWLVFSGQYRIDSSGAITVARDREKIVCRAGH